MAMNRAEKLWALVPFLMIGSVVFMIIRHDHQAAEFRARIMAAEEAERAAVERAAAAAFAAADPAQRLELCLSAMNDRLPYWRPLYALAVHAEGIDALYYWGRQQDGYKRLSCTAAGVSEARVAAPLPGVLSEATGQDVPDVLGAARAALGRAELIEVVVAADGLSLIQRLSTRSADGLSSTLEPADAPEFPWLSTVPMVLATQAEGGATAGRPMLASFPARNWLRDPLAAFDLIERTVPPKFLQRVVGMTLREEDFEIALQGPFPDEAAPYAEVSFDAYGSVTSWLYPRNEPPGFSCPRGIPFTAIRSAFDARCAELACGPRPHLSIASYFCPGNRDPGTWGIHRQS
jgi:hypothetical protein